jgi:DNA-3-methyladenine glycosylase I
LSWSTILNKRENYRKAFANFDVEKVAAFKNDDVTRLMNDSGIIRNKSKILAAISNANRFLEIQKEFGSFSAYIWKFLPDQKQIVNEWKSLSDMPSKTELSDQISADMKKRGFKFFGSTICYSHMQATGMINDHLVHCFRHPLNNKK